MRRSMPCLVLLAALLPGSVARADDEPKKLPLWRAAKEGLVEVTGRSVFEFRVTLVTVTNRSKERLQLDVLGSYFEPDVLDVTHTRGGGTDALVTRDWVQPIGLGLLHKDEARSEITLAAGARVETRVLSFCLERSADPPDEKTALHFVTAPMPKDLLALVEAWQKKPSERQEDVQERIWSAGFPRGAEKPPALPAGARRVVVARGSVYALVGDVLYRGIPGERLFAFAYPVLDVASNGLELYGLFRSSTNPKIRQPGPFVARYGGHSRWVEEQPADGVAHLEWSRNGALLYADAKGVLHATLGKESRELGTDASLSLDEASALVVTRDGGSSTITRIAPRNCRLYATTQTIAGVVSSIALAGDKVYAVTDKGELLELDGSKKPVRREAPPRLGGKRTCRAVHSVAFYGVVVECAEGLFLFGADGEPTRLPAVPAGARVFSAAGQLHALRGSELFTLELQEPAWKAVRFSPD